MLLLAWSRGCGLAMKTMHFLGPGFVLLCTLFSFDLGRVSGLELAGILLLAAVACLNWLAVRLAPKWRATA